MYNKEIKTLTLDTSTGYLVFWDKEHPLATKGRGKVYLHRHLKSLQLDRWLTSAEHVHHIDHNKLNNSLDNLEIIGHGEHSRFHNRAIGFKSDEERLKQCDFCKKEFSITYLKQRYCCNKCAGLDQQKIPLDLTKELMEFYIWEMGYSGTGEYFGVSDNAIKKACRRMGIALLPPYYFNKTCSEKLQLFYSAMETGIIS